MGSFAAEALVEMPLFFQQAVGKYLRSSSIFGKDFVAALPVTAQIAITQKRHASIQCVPAAWSEPQLLVTVVPFQ